MSWAPCATGAEDGGGEAEEEAGCWQSCEKGERKGVAQWFPFICLICPKASQRRCSFPVF